MLRSPELVWGLLPQESVPKTSEVEGLRPYHFPNGPRTPAQAWLTLSPGPHLDLAVLS